MKEFIIVSKIDNLETFPEDFVDWKKISMCKGLTIDFVEKHLNKPWKWGQHGLSSNPSITLQFIKKHIDKQWNWGAYGLSLNPSITPQFIEKHSRKKWYWGCYGLSINSSITPQFVEKHIDKPWDWGMYGLSSNPSITPEFIEKHFNRNWSWKTLSELGIVSIDFLINKDKIHYIVYHPSVNYKRYSKEYNLYHECRNNFTKIIKISDFANILSNYLCPDLINVIIEQLN